MKKRMKPIARQLVGSRVAHQTAEAATQQRQSGRVLNMGSAGDSPAPVGDSPTGTAPSHVGNRPFSLPRKLFPFRPAGRLCYQKRFSKHAIRQNVGVCLPSRSGLSKSKRFGATALRAGWNLPACSPQSGTTCVRAGAIGVHCGNPAKFLSPNEKPRNSSLWETD